MILSDETHDQLNTLRANFDFLLENLKPELGTPLHDGETWEFSETEEGAILRNAINGIDYIFDALEMFNSFNEGE